MPLHRGRRGCCRLGKRAEEPAVFQVPCAPTSQSTPTPQPASKPACVSVGSHQGTSGTAAQLRTHSENEEPAFVPRMLRGSRQRHCNSLGPPRGQRLFVELVCRLEEIPPAAESTMEDGQISLNPRHHPKTTGPLCSVGEEGDLPACTWENR